MTTERQTHYFDANGQTLGRLATQIANALRGKHKIGFTFHQDLGDNVVVTNAEKVRLTGKKASQKMYYRHSLYPGGLKEITFEEMISKHPERVIELAVRTMLPDNRLRNNWMKRLTVRKGENNA